MKGYVAEETRLDAEEIQLVAEESQLVAEESSLDVEEIIGMLMKPWPMKNKSPSMSMNARSPPNQSSCKRQKSPSKPFTPTEAKNASIGAPGFDEISKAAFSTSY